MEPLTLTFLYSVFFFSIYFATEPVAEVSPLPGVEYCNINVKC